MNLDRYKKLADYQIRLEPLEHEPTLIRGNGTQPPPVQVTSTLGTLMYLPAEHSTIGAALQDLPHLIAHIEQLEAENERLMQDMKTVNEVTRNSVNGYQATIQRVRDLHPMLTDDDIETTWCGTCTPKDGAGNYVIWDTNESSYPCPTIQALGDTK